MDTMKKKFTADELLKYVKGELDEQRHRQIAGYIQTNEGAKKLAKRLDLARKMAAEIAGLLPSPEFLAAYALESPFKQPAKPALLEIVISQAKKILIQAGEAVTETLTQAGDFLTMPSLAPVGMRGMLADDTAQKINRPTGYLYDADDMDIRLKISNMTQPDGAIIEGKLLRLKDRAAVAGKSVAFVHPKWDIQTTQINEIGGFVLDNLPIRPNEPFEIRLELADRVIRIVDIRF